MADIWGAIKKTVGKFAPMIGNAIVPGMGGMAGGLIAKALGVDNEPEAIMQGLANASPAQIKAIKDSENRHEERLLEIAKDVDKMFLKDRQDARAREIAVMEATGEKDYNLYILAWVNVIGFFTALIVVIIVDLPTGDVAKTVIATLVGALIATYKDVIGFFFGSSRSSQEKTKLLGKK